jgi:MFS transporter, OFA family, oxalate/formate antiporter
MAWPGRTGVMTTTAPTPPCGVTLDRPVSKRPGSPMTPTDAPAPHRSRLVAGSPVYYGWFVLLAGTLGMMMTIPGQTTGVSIFLDHLIADLGLTRSGVSTLYLIGTLTGSLVLPFVGRFVDQRGPRAAVIVVAAAFALACVWMGLVQDAIMLLIGFTLIRALGQGSLSLVSVHVIAIWFVRRRGVAIGLAGVGMALATATFPTAIEALIEATDWRVAYAILGGVVAVTILPIGALVFRSHPERYGVTVDGGRAAGAAADPPVERTYTADQARGTLTFWLFVVGLFMGSMLSTGLVFHHYSILAEGGLDRLDAAMAFVYFGLASASANLATGVLLSRVAPRHLLAVSLLALAAVLVFAAYLEGPAAVLPYGLLLGFRTGMVASLQGNVFAHYFGRRHLGSVKGAVTTLMVVGSALGPLVLGLGYDAFGDYRLVLLASAVPVAILAAVVPFVRLVRDDGSVR